MANKIEKLWVLHSRVAAYATPTRKLCIHLLRHRLSQAELLEQVAAIRPDPKIRKSQGYYYLGLAYIAAHPADLKLNPLQANLHSRLVRDCDEFLQRIMEVAKAQQADYDPVKIVGIAREIRPRFHERPLQVLKAEVEAACKIIHAESSNRVAKSLLPAQPDEPTPAAKSGKQPQVLTVPQLAKELGISEGKIHTLVKSGKLKATTLGGGKLRQRIQISRRDAEECLNNLGESVSSNQPPRKRSRKQPPGVKQFIK